MDEEKFGNKNISTGIGPPSPGLMKNMSNGSSMNVQEDKQNKTRNTCQNAKWGSILLDYTQETSFHGPKQIAEPQPFILRR